MFWSFFPGGSSVPAVSSFFVVPFDGSGRPRTDPRGFTAA
jgi:hypothetical protein